MATKQSALMPGLFDLGRGIISDFVQSALHLRDLQKLYEEARTLPGECLADSILKVLGIEIDLHDRDRDRLPPTGPVLVVANHPFGLLDGMVLNAMLSRVRPDVKILTNAMIAGLEELKECTIPIDVFGGPDASRKNIASLRQAMTWLREGHMLAMFPAGEVSHWQAKRRRVEDPRWSDLPVRCVKHSGATTMPIYFAGENSLAFHFAGFFHSRLRTGRLPVELLNKRGQTVRVRVGNPIAAEQLERTGSKENAVAYLRARTYMLGHRNEPTSRVVNQPIPVKVATLLIPKPRKLEPVVGRTPNIPSEIAALHNARKCLLETETYAVYAGIGTAIPSILREIARLRELTFRAVGEGTGKALDQDEFDSHYTHLILWQKKAQTIAGAYRMAWTGDVLPKRGIGGLYSSTLFRYSPAFFSRLGPAVELGRSFVCAEFQKDYAPLLLLWQAIARCVASRPGSPVLFGAVSISADLSAAAREVLVQFLRDHNFSHQLARFVTPRAPFRSRLIGGPELQLITKCLHSVEDLASPLSDIESASTVPVLLRQYLRLGGKVAAFNLDRKFSNALDSLVVVDLRDTPVKLLAKYMGTETSASFLSQASLVKEQQLG